MAAVALVLALVLAPDAAAQVRWVYGGFTRSPFEPIAITADPNSGIVTSVTAGMKVDCGADRYFDAGRMTLSPGMSTSGDVLGTTRNANGRFAAQTTRVRVAADGSSTTFHFAIEGRLFSDGGDGTMTARVVARNGVAPAAGTCKTETAKWVALREPRRLFAGMTSQQEPVVIRLNAARARVDNFLVGWHVDPCNFGGQPLGDWQIGDNLADFRIDRHRRFADSFESRQHIDANSDYLYDYKLGGTFSSARTSAHGKLETRVSILDFPIAAMIVCDSRAMTWRARSG